jgi:hypothetical protein
MRPRVIYRSHYQVDEPAYLEFLIKKCTSPVQSTYSERVAQRLSDFVSTRREFNISAAGYALDLARGLGIINDNNTWTEKGHLLGLYASVDPERPIDVEYELDPRERLVHFRLFLEGDGAVMLYIARRAADQKGPIPAYPSETDGGRSVHDWNRFAREMFLHIYREYLAVTGDMSDRIEIRREVDRLAKPFKGRTGVHKCLIHLQSLFRMGLLERSESQSQREYIASDSTADGLRALINHIPDVRALEETVLEGTWAEAAALAFHLGRGEEPTQSAVRSLVAAFYRRMVETGIPFCSLSTLVDAVQVHLLSSGARLVKRDKIVDDLTRLQKERPKDVRFHVDRRGRLAFVKMSPQLVSKLEEGTDHVAATAG